jgi:hypothetical protein
MAAIYTDPVTGIYKDNKGAWFLKDNTPILDYDPKTGAYQENDGTWYSYSGAPLMNYDISLGAYQEEDGTWYDVSGKEVLLGSTLLNAIAAYGYDVSQNQNSSVKKVSVNTKETKKPSLLVPILAIAGLSLVLVVIYNTVKK